MFEPLDHGLYVMKMHSHGSKHNVNMLKQNNLNYCILYRDLRDAAVSHYFYVRSTPWHPEHQDYYKLDIKEGMIYFSETRLDEWSKWIKSWKDNRDKKRSIEIKYEDMLNKNFETFKKVVKLFNLDDSEKMISSIVEKNSIGRKRKEESFFRKGIAGDWKNYFDEEIKILFKKKIANLLIELGYESDTNW
jgi:hypothetical protein